VCDKKIGFTEILCFGLSGVNSARSGSTMTLKFWS